MAPAPPDWLVLQLADSAFPAGGFAHSGGLEASLHLGAVTGGEGLRAFLRDAVAQAAHGALPLVRAAHDAPGAWAELDAEAGAFLTSPVARRASCVQGRAWVDTAARVFSAEIAPMRVRSRSEGLGPHLAPAFGVVAQALGVGRAVTERLFLFAGARSVLAAAVRLGITGPHEAQRILREASPLLDEALALSAPLGPRDLSQTAPLIDLYQSLHPRLYARLFQS